MSLPVRTAMMRKIAAAAFVAGLTAATWYAEFATSGGELWDREEYWTIALPLYFVTVLVAQAFAPVSILLWPLLVAATQLFVMTYAQGVGAFLLTGLGLLTILSLPNIFAAWIGSAIARRFSRGQQESPAAEP